jgi:hypothetical protein
MFDAVIIYMEEETILRINRLFCGHNARMHSFRILKEMAAKRACQTHKSSRNN